MNELFKKKYLLIIFFVFLGFSFFIYRNMFYVNKSSRTIDIHSLENKKNIVPLLVVGSGCAGYSAALYGARGKMKTIVLAGNEPGGQLSGTTKVENWPGLANQLGPDIIQKLKEQAESFGAEVLYDSLKDIDLSAWPYQVTTESGKQMNALSVVVAAGASPSKLGIPGEEEFWGQGVTTCAVCDAPFHKDKDVIVVGGGDSAAEMALQLTSYAKTITILVRRDEMRASLSMQEKLKAIDKISIVYNSELKEIYGDEHVTGVKIYNNKLDEYETKSVSGVFLAIGHIPNSQPYVPALKVDKEGYIITQGRTQVTNIPGVFAAGDVEDKIYRQAGVAAGSGIRAALDALAFLQHHEINNEFLQKISQQLYTTQEVKEVPHVIIESVTSFKDFEQLKKDHKLLIVDVYTTFCPSCKVMMPVFEKVVAQYSPALVGIKINAKDMNELSRMYKINSVPTLLLFKDGNLVDRRNEAQSEQELLEFVKQVF